MLGLTLPDLILALFLGLSNVRGLQVPKAKGPFEVGTTTFELTDHSRLDPFAPTPENRSVQLSVHYPISKANTRFPFSTYLPALTANDTETILGIPAGTLLNVSTNSRLDAPILNGGHKIPVILFSPGLGVSRLLYTIFVQDLASEGYAVISIDHPRDASIVELSDGRVIAGNITTSPADIDLAVAVRAADSRFILNELAAKRNFKVPGLTKQGLGTSRVGFFGHSLGGATAATTIVLDRRVACGVNMDGSFEGPDVQRGFSKPFLIMASEGHNRTIDPTWAAVWPKLHGFKREIEVKGALHLTYTDGPVLTNLLGVKLPESLGTIDALRFDKIQHAYLTAFFDFGLGGKKEKLLDGPSKAFPEVSFAPQV